ANATNRVAVAGQSLAGVTGFVRAGAVDRVAILPVVGTALVGAMAGALAATRVPVAVLEKVLLVAMIVMAIVLVVRPGAVVADDDGEPARWRERGAGAVLALLATGVYGGFVQAGVGFLLMAVLSGRLGYSIGRASALKTVATLVFSAVSL